VCLNFLISRDISHSESLVEPSVSVIDSTRALLLGEKQSVKRQVQFTGSVANELGLEAGS
jgi:hypothetical protein